MTQEPHGDMGNIEAEILWNVCQTLFGDNVDYVGNVLSTYPERRRANFVRICNAALRRLGDQVNEPGAVPPSVIGFLLNEGSYTTGVVSSEYAGGFVACSRTANPTDERALRRLLTVNRLGEYAVRSHYHFYSALRLLILHTRNAPAVDFERDRFNLATFIPAGYYILAMDYNRDEIARMPRIISDVLYALGQEFLLDGSNSGTDDYLRSQFAKSDTGAVRGEGIVFAPSILGIQLFLWAFGRRDRDHLFFLDPDMDCRIEGVPMGIDEAGLMYKEKQVL